MTTAALAQHYAQISGRSLSEITSLMEFYPQIKNWKHADLFFKGKPQHNNDRFSREHPRMSVGKRAKIFAPFAALSGYSEAVAAKEIVYEPKKEMSEEKRARINQQLTWLEEHTYSEKIRTREGLAGPLISVTFFQKNVLPIDRTLAVNGDTENGQQLEDGRERGQYRTIKGAVLRVDQMERKLTISEGMTQKEILFEDIWEMHAVNKKN